MSATEEEREAKIGQEFGGREGGEVNWDEWYMCMSLFISRVIMPNIPRQTYICDYHQR